MEVAGYVEGGAGEGWIGACHQVFSWNIGVMVSLLNPIPVAWEHVFMGRV